jgi:hypothetical protein
VGELGEIKGPHRQVFEARLDIGRDIIPPRGMVRVSKDLDVGMQRLQGVFGVLAEAVLVSPRH